METHQQLFKIREALNRVSHDLQLSNDSPDSGSSAIKALLELQKPSGSNISANPLPFSLSQHLSQLADSVQELHNSKPSRNSIISFVTRRVWSHEVSRLAAEVESELQALIDRETVSKLATTIAEMRNSSDSSPSLSLSLDEDKLLDEMCVLQERLSRGFDINLQHLLLKTGIFAELEWVLCNPIFSRRVRERAAVSVKKVVLYNKDVFVGSVLVGGSVRVLVSMGSLCSLQVLSSLIKAIKSPLVDEMDSSGGILKIVSYLSSNEFEIKIMAMDCVMEIGYFGRKEAIEAMLNGGVIKKLVELQRSDLIDKCARDVCEKGKEMKYPFASCVARFAVQLEVGEGLRQREKRASKQLILNKVREACVSDAECATIVAEVLWGSSP
ncbi:hypothetical protein DH2020_039354 [Rehmannia glutinosa]|uniref:Uncharacterized protein n=1 Tax=Rehmannia glutinosa TaxID=99300 RepID=A0ABR0UX76_REHGL